VVYLYNPNARTIQDNFIFVQFNKKLHHDSTQPKIIGEGLTYDDVFISTNRASREVSIKPKFSRNITLNVPVSAAMDNAPNQCYGYCYGARGRDSVCIKT
jgi:hypothetical protein